MLLVVFALAAWVVFGGPSGTPEGWGHDFDAAVAEGERAGRPVVAAFHSHGCPPCAAMDRYVLRSPAVKEILRTFEPVQVDAASRPDLLQRFDIAGTPTYVVIAPGGRPVAQVSGYYSAEAFAEFLARAAAMSVNAVTPTGGTSPPAVP